MSCPYFTKVPELMKQIIMMVKFLYWQKSSKMFISIQIQMWIHHEDEVTYVCVSFHPYHVCKDITYVVLMS